MKFLILGVMLLAGCSQSTFAQEEKQDTFGVQTHVQDMERSCTKAKGAYQIQQFTIPDGTTKFQFVCTNVQQPKPQPPVDTNKVGA